MVKLVEMPLFPLGTVLFPGMTLPLHIFEDRYKLMISECLQANAPFGVLLIEEGHEVGSVAKPFEIGTSAYITQAETLSGGRMNIMTVGYQRIKVHEFKRDKPYLSGLIEPIPIAELQVELEVNSPATLLRTALLQYLDLFLKNSDGADINLAQIPQEPLPLALFTAITMPFPQTDKQVLLSQPDLQGILLKEIEFLKREMMLLRHMVEYTSRPQDIDFSNN